MNSRGSHKSQKAWSLGDQQRILQELVQRPRSVEKFVRFLNPLTFTLSLSFSERNWHLGLFPTLSRPREGEEKARKVSEKRKGNRAYSFKEEKGTHRKWDSAPPENESPWPPAGRGDLGTGYMNLYVCIHPKNPPSAPVSTMLCTSHR